MANSPELLEAADLYYSLVTRYDETDGKMRQEYDSTRFLVDVSGNLGELYLQGLAVQEMAGYGQEIELLCELISLNLPTSSVMSAVLPYGTVLGIGGRNIVASFDRQRDTNIFRIQNSSPMSVYSIQLYGRSQLQPLHSEFDTLSQYIPKMLMFLDPLTSEPVSIQAFMLTPNLQNIVRLDLSVLLPLITIGSIDGNNLRSIAFDFDKFEDLNARVEASEGKDLYPLLLILSELIGRNKDLLEIYKLLLVKSGNSNTYKNILSMMFNLEPRFSNRLTPFIATLLYERDKSKTEL